MVERSKVEDVGVDLAPTVEVSQRVEQLVTLDLLLEHVTDESRDGEVESGEASSQEVW